VSTTSARRRASRFGAMAGFAASSPTMRVIRRLQRARRLGVRARNVEERFAASWSGACIDPLAAQQTNAVVVVGRQLDGAGEHPALMTGLSQRWNIGSTTRSSTWVPLLLGDATCVEACPATPRRGGVYSPSRRSRIRYRAAPSACSGRPTAASHCEAGLPGASVKS
jgi:hypothetical protein